jgi:hypothetical protein
MPNDWMATLHTDLYYQSEAWTRIFNMPGYDKLKAYTNVNLAAIFTNENAGWKVMAYVKNVFDRNSITGSFLNSDDTGLTTNVFLTEPRLYGLRVTKEWSGGEWWPAANPNHVGAYPLQVELGGSLGRHDAPYSPVHSAGDFTGNLDPARIQNQDLALGEGGEVRLTYSPSGSPWSVSGALRFGKTKGHNTISEEHRGEGVCGFPAPYDAVYCAPDNPLAQYLVKYDNDRVRGDVFNYEKHMLVDFEIGRDVGMGMAGGLASRVSGGLRYAEFESDTRLRTKGVPDGHIPQPWFNGPGDPAKYATHTFYRTDLVGQREFKGFGPTLTWDVSKMLAETRNGGSFDLDASITGGVLFGKHRTTVGGTETATLYSGPVYPESLVPDGPATPTQQPAPRSTSATVPLLSLELGVSYKIERAKLSTGYRWERYFDVLDAGFDNERDADRTIDGPYFKIAVGFGG